MKTMFTLFIITCIAFQLMASGGHTQEISGRIVDKHTGEPIVGVNITTVDKDTAIGTITDENGEFKLWNVPTDKVSLKVSYPGYKSETIENPRRNNEEALPFVIELEDKTETKQKHKFSLFNKKHDASKELGLCSSK